MPARQYPLKVQKFQDLMPYRIREVLLVSSPYDAFILEEDGLLSEQVFFEYRELSLPGPPRFTHVSTGREALALLETRRYDLILTMSSMADMGVSAFGRRVKRLRPGRPVVLLALDRKELHYLRDGIDANFIDGVFLWTGDSQILLAIIKYVEDRENVDLDMERGGVRAIIVIEDSPRYYSSFLALLYKELMRHSRSLYSEGVNELHRRMYMRSRPKILHATSYEEGVELFQRYRDNVMSIISDVRVPRESVLDSSAGLDFVRFARDSEFDLPVLVLSAESENAARAAELGAAFLDKSSPSLLAELRSFLTDNLGFGDFVFRDLQGRQLARASDVRELEEKLATIPEESLVEHASKNHFSVWLMARSEFEVAKRIRPKQLSDFANAEALRQYLIEVLRETYRSSQHGVISDYSRPHFDQDHFSRLGQGSLGGKARGIAFLNLGLAQTDAGDFGGLDIRVPKTVVITTDHFDDFVERNGLRDLAYTSEDDEQIAKSFLDGRLDNELRSDLGFIIQHMQGPLAVRSSSLLEDSMHEPFAGIYTTLMIPNAAREPQMRLQQICDAVKLIYASTFFSNAKSYLRSTGHRVEEEKMAVIVQKLVGQLHGPRFYPHFSGVAQSYNFYPIGKQTPEDGIVHLALGLGRLVVDGGLALRFSPKLPSVVPQFSTAKALLESTQREFYALDMRRPCCEAGADLYSTVRRFDLKDAELDGTLSPVGSVYSPDDRQVRDDLSLAGPRVITFNNILKHKAIPLAEAVSRLLEIASVGLGCPVELEFACNMGDWGLPVRPRRPGNHRTDPALYVLQVRPFASRTTAMEAVQMNFRREDLLCASKSSLGHGIEESIRDIVYVCRDRWDAAHNKAIAAEVGSVNEELTRQERPYLLVGPGRWGTADQWLGIPVQWSQISGVRAIVEASPKGYNVEPSQGTHFFHNITSLRVGYLTLPAGVDKASRRRQFMDWDWLDSQPTHQETEHLRLVRLSEPLTVVLNGREGRGIIAKPGATAR